MNSHSQNEEDLIVIKHLQECNIGIDSLTCLSLGENDGKTFSNVLNLIKLGASAHLVEASDTVFVDLKSLHASNKKVHLYNIGIGKKNGKAIFYESDTLLNEGDLSLVSTIEPEELKRWESSNIKFTEKEIDVYDFPSFHKMSEFSLFDIVSIDVEGLDFDILSQMNLSEIGCQVLIVEFNGIDKSKYVDYVNGFGLRLIHENPENLIFVK